MTPKKRGRYRKYPEAIKKAVVAAGRADLFPHIPRTTALHWIENNWFDPQSKQDEVIADKIRLLERQIEKERALRILVQKVRTIFPYDLGKKRLTERK